MVSYPGIVAFLCQSKQAFSLISAELGLAPIHDPFPLFCLKRGVLSENCSVQPPYAGIIAQVWNQLHPCSISCVLATFLPFPQEGHPSPGLPDPDPKKRFGVW